VREVEAVVPQHVAVAVRGIDAGAAKVARCVGLVIDAVGSATTLTATLVDVAPKNVVPCSSCHWKL
jgi:hypothetical protein